MVETDHSDRQYAEPVKTMAEFHRKTWGIVVLHRCMLNPADVTFTQAEKENPGADCDFKLSFQPG